MVIVRIGNNIHFLWKIYNNNGSKYALSGNVRRLWLSSASLEKEIETYQIQYRNELAFTIDADDLTRYGTYKLVLQLKESDSQTEDATYDLTQLFQIVARTYPGACKESNGEVDVQVTSVLNNVVVERIEGLSAYEIAVNEGYVGSESEWLESLNGVGIASIDQTVIAVDDGSYNEVTFTLTNGETYTIRIRNGSKGAVTRDDIIFALGYTPVTPAELAAKTDIFFATYNSTTWQEINEAVNAGKAVFLKKDEDIYPLVGDGGVTPKLWEFAFVDTGLDYHRAVCYNDDTWQSATRGLATVIDLASKQDVISDLAAIRAGAALGATAYQKPSTGIPASDMASGVIPDISGKQDTLVSGSNIKTINGTSILGSGNIVVQTEITMDNVPTSGSDNPVKSGGLYTALAAKQNNLTFDNTPVASSNNPVKSGGLYTVLAEKIGSQDIDNVVELTLAQYNALDSKDARTMYIVSDSAIPSDHVGVASIVQTTTSTADGGTNVVTCTLTNDVTTTFQIKNGNQGNSGYTGAAGELEVVNNLTDGGATAALSAEMGKTLEGEISQLGLEVDDKIGAEAETLKYNPSSQGTETWYWNAANSCFSANSNWYTILIPLTSGRQYSIDGSSISGYSAKRFFATKPAVNVAITPETDPGTTFTGGGQLNWLAVTLKKAEYNSGTDKDYEVTVFGYGLTNRVSTIENKVGQQTNIVEGYFNSGSIVLDSRVKPGDKITGIITNYKADGTYPQIAQLEAYDSSDNSLGVLAGFNNNALSGIQEAIPFEAIIPANFAYAKFNTSGTCYIAIYLPSAAQTILHDTDYANSLVNTIRTTLLPHLFLRGGLNSGVVYLGSQFYRATSFKMWKFVTPVTLVADTGYRFGVHSFVNGVFSADSGWQTTYTIPKNTTFRIVIAKQTEDTSTPADIDTFVGAIKINSGESILGELYKALEPDFLSMEVEKKKVSSVYGGQGLTKVDSKYIQFHNSAADHSTYNIIRVWDAEFNYLGSMSHNLGHAASADYNPDANTVIVGNGSSDTTVLPRLDIILNASQKIILDSVISYSDSDILHIELSGTNKALGGSGLVACYGGNWRIVYLATGQGNEPRRIFKCILGVGEEDFSDQTPTGTDPSAWGTFISGKTNSQYNGTLKVLSVFTGPETEAYQGICYRNGFIYMACGYSTPYIRKIRLRTTKFEISQTVIPIDYNADGTVISAEPEGLCFVDANTMLVGLPNYEGMFTIDAF